MDKIKFFFNFLRDRQVASITPTARMAVEHTCKPIDRTKPVVVVEYGPGTGVFTRHLMSTLAPGSRIIAIDRNEDFAKDLPRRATPKFDSKDTPAVQLESLHDDARRVADILHKRGIDQADYVISGIPFSFLSVEDKATLAAKTRAALKPGGMFIVYQVTFHMEPWLRETFDDVRTHWYWLNVPPLAIMEATTKRSR